MRKLLLLLFLACLAIPVFAQTTTAPTVPQRAPMRDPFAKPTAEQLKNLPVTAPAPRADLEVEDNAAVATYPESAVTTDSTESHAVMVEPESTAGDTAMWVLGGIAALGLIGALAYVILGMGQDDTTVYNT